jgi:hypothetical protein
MSNFGNSRSNSNQSIQLNTNEAFEQRFFQQDFQLIQTLPISFPNEQISATLYNFIRSSVYFWFKVIFAPKNEEYKYTIESLSEGTDYFASIFKQCQNQKQEEALPKTNTVSSPELPLTTIGENSQKFEESSEKSNSSSLDNLQTSDEERQKSEKLNPNSSDNLENSNSIDQLIISQISECYCLIYPSAEDNAEVTPLEQLGFIRTSLETFIFFSEKTNSSHLSFLKEILKNFDFLHSFPIVDEFKLLNIIFPLSKSISNDIFEISKFLIGEHPKTSISDELKQILRLLKKEIPNKMKSFKDKCKIKVLNSYSSFPLIPSYLQIFHDFSKIFLYLTKFGSKSFVIRFLQQFLNLILNKPFIFSLVARLLFLL